MEEHQGDNVECFLNCQKKEEITMKTKRQRDKETKKKKEEEGRYQGTKKEDIKTGRMTLPGLR